ncbi:MAG: bacillithiol biosynthesis deacetylase BshB1 [bacterium]
MKLDVLAIAAHPDDIEMCAGGFLFKMWKFGYKTGVIDLTKGEAGTFGTPEQRKKESIKASAILRLSARETLDMGDTKIFNSENNGIVLAEKIRKYRPKALLLPYWQDQHPDHITTSMLGEKARFYAGLKNLKIPLSPHKIKMVFYYQLHEFVTPNFIVDISDEFAVKMKAVKAYRSQFETKERKNFLKKIETKSQFCGSLIQTQYGEPFISKVPLKIHDPLKMT